MSDKKTFKFGKRIVEITAKEDLNVDIIIDRDNIKSYLIKSERHTYAMVQCTKKYFIVLYFGQDCGYIYNKKDNTTELFEFSCPDANLDFFELKKFKSINHAYNYEGDDSNSEKILMYRDGVIYINSKGYIHNEKERT